MSYKPKKTNNIKNKKTNNKKIKQNKDKEKKNGFKFGHNGATYLLLTGITVLAFLIIAGFIIAFGKNGYVTVYNENKANPYNDDSWVKENASFMNGSDFNDFDVDFYCESFIQEGSSPKASFSLTLTQNENTPTIGKLNSQGEAMTSSGSYGCIAMICLAADWVNYTKYSATNTSSSTMAGSKISYSKIGADKEKSSSTTISVSLDKENSFPMKAKTWPVEVKIDSPDAYLYLYYFDMDNLKYKEVVLHYTYDEYVTTKTSPTIKK